MTIREWLFGKSLRYRSPLAPRDLASLLQARVDGEPSPASPGHPFTGSFAAEGFELRRRPGSSPMSAYAPVLYGRVEETPPGSLIHATFLSNPLISLVFVAGMLLGGVIAAFFITLMIADVARGELPPAVLLLAPLPLLLPGAVALVFFLVRTHAAREARALEAFLLDAARAEIY
jgi:hypothetical protein